MSRFLTRLLHDVTLAVIVLSTAPARAEIGVVAGENTGPAPTPFIQVGIITDDGDPIMHFWVRQHLQGPYSILNENGDVNGDGRPDLVVHPQTRVPLVAWARNSASGFDVVVARFENGAWQGPDVVVDLAEDALDPRMAVDPATGEVHLVYWVAGAATRVEHRVAPADLSSWSPATVVSQPGEAAMSAHAAFHGGVLRVAYEVDTNGAGTTPREVVLSRYQGGSFVPEVVAVTHHAGEVRPEVHSHAGRLWVDWVDAEGEIGWTRFDASSGTWDPVSIEPYGSLEELEFHVRGAVKARAIR